MTTSPSSDGGPVLYACRLTGTGSSQPLMPDGMVAADGLRAALVSAVTTATREAPVWLHLTGGHEQTRAVLEALAQETAVPTLAVDALMAAQTRPRCLPMDPGVQINLRGVNLNTDADPEDMVSVRLWVSDAVILTVRIRRLLAMDDIRQALDSGRGPVSSGDFLVHLSRALGLRAQPVVEALQEKMDQLEDETSLHQDPALREALADERRRIIVLARYLRPQVDALDALIRLDPVWLTARRRQQLAPAADRFRRLVEDLDAARDHAAVLQDQVAASLADRMSRAGFTLSVLASVFLPLGFLTGLLGINVAGIPYAEQPWMFWAVCVFLVVLAGGQLAVFRLKRWI